MSFLRRLAWPPIERCEFLVAAGVGMFLQTFLVALTERGLGSCAQMVIAGFPDVVRETPSIRDQYEILCGLAIGYPVTDFPTNNLNIARNPLDKNVIFLDF
jgi:nitroreductase